MNRNQLERLNKVLKSVVDNANESPEIKDLTYKIESYKEQLKTAEPEEFENINYWIDFYNKEIEKERLKPSGAAFKSYKCVRNQLLKKLVDEYKKNDRDLKEWVSKYEVYNDEWHEYGFDICYKRLNNASNEIKKIIDKYTDEAEKVVEDMEENGEFEQYYLIHSGKQDYLNKVAKMNLIKTVQSKLNDVINDYAVKFAMLTIDDFKTYVSLWNEYINEPCAMTFESLYKVKYLGKLYDVYKYEVEDSVLYERVQCCTVDGVKKDLSNIYLKELRGEAIEIVNSESVKPFDVITYKGVTYEVYKINVVGSELYKRVKAKSTISNKTRDFKNYYLRKVL